MTKLIVETQEKDLPTCWEEGIVAHADLGLTPTARLKMRLIIFKSTRALNDYWKEHVGSSLGRGCLGAVNSLSWLRSSYGYRDYEAIVVDPRFFCIVGLVKGHLGTEIICHESVHAAFCYAKRKGKKPWDARVEEFDEEKIAYPAGIVARKIVAFLRYRKLIDD